MQRQVADITNLQSVAARQFPLYAEVPRLDVRLANVRIDRVIGAAEHLVRVNRRRPGLRAQEIRGKLASISQRPGLEISRGSEGRVRVQRALLVEEQPPRCQPPEILRAFLVVPQRVTGADD